jgi:hypothetical protein
MQNELKLYQNQIKYLKENINKVKKLEIEIKIKFFLFLVALHT